VTKDDQRQGMSELLAKQRAGPAITPAEATRQRRSSRRELPTASNDPRPPGGRPVIGTESPGDPARADETRTEESRATPDVRGEIGEVVDPEAAINDDRMAVQDSRLAVPRRVVSRAASNKGLLLAAACAVAVPIMRWLAAARRRRATAPAAEPSVRMQLWDKAGEAGRRAAWAARSAWSARRA
jgi:hypothetical protein